MSERDSYNPGEFCWVDLAVPSTEAGAEFYNELLGVDWEQGAEEFGGYGMFTQKGKVVAGMGPLQNEEHLSAWSGYISVEDADVPPPRSRRPGEPSSSTPSTSPPRDGWRSSRPAGRLLQHLAAGETAGAQLVNEVGTWTWNHLTTTDLDGAKKFYGDVFGWTLEKAEVSSPTRRSSCGRCRARNGTRASSGAAEMGEETPSGAPRTGWPISGCQRRRRGEVGQRRRRPGDGSGNGDPHRQAGGLHRLPRARRLASSSRTTPSRASG